MEKRIVKVEVTRYYSKTGLVLVEVDSNVVDDELVDYLTNYEDLDSKYEDALSGANLIGEETTYEWDDPTNNTGGTL